MTSNKVAAGLSAALVSMALLGGMSGTAVAGCEDTGTCPQQIFIKKKIVKTAQAGKLRKPVKVSVRKLSGKRVRAQSALAVAVPRGRGTVVAMIKAQAPRYGVPTWFALRIAQIESGYNPRARGAAGEIGVFQMKCSTARGLGFRGSCAGLYNAATNIQYGLKHLQLAVRSSKGNLHLAASKHNGGLGRKTLVRKYVNRVF
jgi:soluble lytic murein transglycosylase-like protein